ncbi:MAG: type II toxin-antitoxin system RelB/DinJ family antitoxin [Neisseriaceae bacterium]|nr:type II toxin-antitoxin system RelB/DinJ family antitoxin [Neisseriaceae bacterium]
MAATTTNYNLRIDKEIKNQAFKVIEDYGLTPSMVLKAFLKQIADRKILPLSFDYQADEPNEETKQAMREAIENRQNGNLKGYADLNKMVKDIQEWTE